MENEKSVIEQEIVTIWKRIDEHKVKIEELETKAHARDLMEVEQRHRLKELISEAVEKGNEKSALALSAMDRKLEKFMQASDARIRVLEDKDKTIALEKQKQEEEEKNENRRHIFKTAIACVITGTIMFFLTLLLNQLWLTIS